MSTRGAATGLTILAFALGSLAQQEGLDFRGQVKRGAWLPHGAEWRAGVEMRSPRWSFEGAVRRVDGEQGALPHASAWLERRLPAGWCLSLGDHRVASATGAVAGVRRGSAPGAWDELLGVTPGTLSRSTPEERGLVLRRDSGPLRGGLILARSRRDMRQDGDGFVLDLEHADDNTARQGAWRDGLELAWLTAEGPFLLDVQGVLGRRRNPDGARPLAGLQLLRRHPGARLVLAWEQGESNLVRTQVAWKRRTGWAQLDVWRGRQLVPLTRHSRSALPLGGDRKAGGVQAQAGLPVGKGGLAVDARWLEKGARGGERSALRWSAELTLPLTLTPGLRWRLRHTAAEDRPQGSMQDRWRLAVQGGGKGLSWHGDWEDAADWKGHTRSWSFAAQKEWKGRRGGVGLGLAMSTSHGQGPVRLVPISLAPGILTHGALVGERQFVGVGAWLEQGGQRLAVDVVMREVQGEKGVERDTHLDLLWALGWPR